MEAAGAPWPERRCVSMGDELPERAFIAIPVDIHAVRVLRTESNADTEVVRTVERTRTRVTCRICGRTMTERHGSDELRILRHLPSLGRPVFLRIRPKRFRHMGPGVALTAFIARIGHGLKRCKQRALLTNVHWIQSFQLGLKGLYPMDVDVAL